MSPNKMKNDDEIKNVHELCEKNDEKDLRKLLEKNKVENQINQVNGYFPLHTSVLNKSLECTITLLNNHAVVDCISVDGWTPLHFVAIRGNKKFAQLLINNNCDLAIRDHREQTALHLAAIHGNCDVLSCLLSNGVSINDVDDMEWTAVHAASFHGRLSCLQCLDRHNASLDAMDSEGNLPIHLAASQGQLYVVKYLISKLPLTIDCLNKKNETPKDIALASYQDEIAKYLSEITWEKNNPEEFENMSFPAHVAAFHGNVEQLDFLIRENIIRINERDENGNSILHKAVLGNSVKCVEWLLGHNCNDQSHKNNVNESPIEIAVRNNYLEIRRILEDFTQNNDSDDEKAYNDEYETNRSEDAKYNAKLKIEEIEEELRKAESNYRTLGGSLEKDNKYLILKDEFQNDLKDLEMKLAEEKYEKKKLLEIIDRINKENERLMTNMEDAKTLLLTDANVSKPPKKKVIGKPKRTNSGSDKRRTNSRNGKEGILRKKSLKK
ncbi:hypothetical protein SNEBB_009220 [Seison nebaliae]|nr:hypothetical protein SNEBB_009220 [Seison nebaliae]